MQLDRNMLSRLLSMNDEQLSAFIRSVATESGIDPAQLGIRPESMQAIRAALGGATEEDLKRLTSVYNDYQSNRKK